MEKPFLLGDWVVDPAAHQLRREGTEVRLEPKVMRVLDYLATREGEVVTRHELESEVWPGMIVTDDAVTNTVIKLRKALGDSARNPKYIKTIAKSGYRLIARTAPVTVAAADSPSGGVSIESPAPVSTKASRRFSESAISPALDRRHVLLFAIVAALALVIAWWVSRVLIADRNDPAAVANERPVIAVLPFENLSASPEQDYFAGGMAEDLITELSKLSGLQVVARNSVFAYRGSSQSERRIGQELGARYIVKGSVQRAAGRLRIHVRLTDAIAGRNRWAERYDREMSDIFRVQDEITVRVVTALQVELAPAEQQRLTRHYAASVEAYDQFLRGHDLLGRRSSADNPEARAHFERAIELEPGFARAYGGLALAYSQEAVFGHGPRVAESLTRARELARQGLEIDDSLPQLRYVLGLVEMYRGNLAAAIAEVSRAIELRPSYADGFGLLAWTLHFAGRPNEGLEAMRQAIALNPRVPSLYRTVKAALHYELGELEQALSLLQESVEMSPNQLLTRLYLAVVYAATDQLEAARWEAEEVRALEPGFKFDPVYGFPIRDPEYRERFLADLRRAGLWEP